MTKSELKTAHKHLKARIAAGAGINMGSKKNYANPKQDIPTRPNKTI